MAKDNNIIGEIIAGIVIAIVTGYASYIFG